MDKIRQIIVDRAKERHRSLRNLSIAIEKHPGYLHQFVNYGSPSDLPEKVRRSLAKELDVPERLLTAGAVDIAEIAALPRLPVMGHALAGSDTIMINEGPIEYVERPHFLANVPDAFAVFSWGTSMEPRFRPGLLLYINPHRPPRQGDDVLVEKNNGEALIKEFIKETGDHLILKQLNPAKTLKIALDQVRGAYKIVGIVIG